MMTHRHTLNRRAFLRQAGAATLLANLLLYKPVVAKTLTETLAQPISAINPAFSTSQKKRLNAVHSHLFPADGDGPSAADINALGYLEFALTDPKNIADGDRDYIINGMAWLEKIAAEKGKTFTSLSTQQQHQVLEKLAESQRGDNWLSLLVYYILEALLLDPVYGGNTNAIGWAWLDHKAGFPRPTKDKNYRHYLQRA